MDFNKLYLPISTHDNVDDWWDKVNNCNNGPHDNGSCSVEKLL